MAIVFEKTKVKGGFPIFWRGEFAVLPGDFKLKGTYPEGTKIPKSIVNLSVMTKRQMS